jgi:hypothetical protein
MRSILPLVSTFVIAVSVAGQPLKPAKAVKEVPLSQAAFRLEQSDLAEMDTVAHPETEQPQGVPESASLALLGIGLSGLGALKVRKRF